MADKMKAAVFESVGVCAVKEVNVPAMKNDDDVLLKVETASICGTDCHILSDPPGHPGTVGSILGHEYVGKVLEAGKAVTHLKPGDRVVVDPNTKCGVCRYCRMGMDNMCSNMSTLGIFMDGGFAPYNVAPAKALFPIPMDLPAEKAVFAEPLSCVMNGFRKVRCEPGETVLILGAGPIGLLYIHLFKTAGAGKILVAELSPFRTRYATESGADRVINPNQEDLREVVEQETGIGVDIVVDAVGSLIVPALKAARRGGRVLLFGMNSNAQATIKQNEITRNELTLLGTFIAAATFPAAIKLLASPRFDPTNLITHRMTLDEICSGIDLMRKGEAIEIVVVP